MNPDICYSGKMHLINLKQKISFHLVQSEIVGHFRPWDNYKTLCQRALALTTQQSLQCLTMPLVVRVPGKHIYS